MKDKTELITFMMNKKDKNLIDTICLKNNINRSEFIRISIKPVIKALKENKIQIINELFDESKITIK